MTKFKLLLLCLRSIFAAPFNWVTLLCLAASWMTRFASVKGKVVGKMALVVLLIGVLALSFCVQPVRADPRTWIVDDDGPADFDNIQDAINNASSSDTIIVRNGTYHQNVVVNKPLFLTGEIKYGAIIDGGGSGNVVTIAASNVSISNFTIRNSGTTGHA
ncbi:MAG: hypothetical protein AB1457_19050 [Chloroflexota bacterium]